MNLLKWHALPGLTRPMTVPKIWGYPCPNGKG